MNIVLPRKPLGITLIEVLMTLVILATLIGIALPSFGNIGQSTGSRSARSVLAVSLNQARSSAVMGGHEVVACPSSDQFNCTGGTRWHQGWILFADRNQNQSRDGDETVLAVNQQQPRGVAIVSTSGRRYVRYRADGTSRGSNLTLTVCDRRGPEHASTLIINNAGRVRTGSANAANAASACAAIDT